MSPENNVPAFSAPYYQLRPHILYQQEQTQGEGTVRTISDFRRLLKKQFDSKENLPLYQLNI